MFEENRIVTELVYKDESFAMMGACFNVYNAMGCGFLEAVYQECLQIEFSAQDIPATAQPELALHYRDHRLAHGYRPDFLCFEKIVLEVKAVDRLANEHRAQVLNYLHAGRYQLGLLVNFGHHPKLEYERIALTRT